MNLLALLLSLPDFLRHPSQQPLFPTGLDRRPEAWELGNGFSFVRRSDSFHIYQGHSVIWNTIPGEPFISASAGSDLVNGSNGAFNITHVDVDQCVGQNVTTVYSTARSDALHGLAVRLDGHLLDCGSATAPYSLTLWVPDTLTDRVAFSLRLTEPNEQTLALSKLYLRFASHADEDFFGLGAQASFASLKNHSIPIFSREQGVGRGDEPITSILNHDGSFTGGDRYTAYTAIPSYITTDARLFYLAEESAAYANFDFTSPDAVTLRYHDRQVEGMLSQAGTMLDAVELLTAYTGRMPALPAWVDNGAILGLQGGQDKVKRVVERGLDVDCPIAAVWLQDWCGTHSQTGPYVNLSRLWWNWESDDDLYPTWAEFVHQLRSDHNVRTLSYVNPFLTDVSTKSNGYRRNLFNEAASLGYLVRNSTTNSPAVVSSGPGLHAGIIDLTNPDLRAWFAEVLRTQMWTANISGYMSDFGEYTPVHGVSFAGTTSDAFTFHNRYPSLWAEFQHELTTSLHLSDEALIFHRSASTGSARHMNLFWAGDQNVDWGEHDGLKSALTIAAHMGLSGFAHIHTDIGGYTAALTTSAYNLTRSPELLARWAETAALAAPVFRSHEGNIPAVNAQFYDSSEAYQAFARAARLFVALAPYRRRVLATECARRGWPLTRPPVVYHPTDLRARAISYQSFFLGAHVFVAPVVEPGADAVRVYFPGSDSYVHVWSGRRYEGGSESLVEAPIGKPAVFLVNGVVTKELETFMDWVRRENGTIREMEDRS